MLLGIPEITSCTKIQILPSVGGVECVNSSVVFLLKQFILILKNLVKILVFRNKAFTYSAEKHLEK